MSDAPQQSSGGPVMLAATSIMKPPPLRIGHIGGNLTLPRTVRVLHLAIGTAGATLGIAVGLVAGGGLRGGLYGGLLLGMAAIALVSWSPLRGESLLKAVGLQVSAHSRQVTVEGRPVRLAVGVAYVAAPERGRVRVAPGAADVLPGSYDEHGVPRTPGNRNLEGPQPSAHRPPAPVGSAVVAAPPVPATPGRPATSPGQTPPRPGRPPAPTAAALPSLRPPSPGTVDR